MENSVQQDVAISQNPFQNTDQIRSLVCQRCWEKLFGVPGSLKAILEAETNLQGFSYTTNRSEISESAKAGCAWCGLISKDVEKARRYTGDGDFGVFLSCGREQTLGKFFAKFFNPVGHQRLNIVIGKKGFPDGNKGYQGGRYDIYTESGDPASQFIVCRNNLLEVSSPLAYKLGMNHLEECIRDHEECPKPVPTALPTRVIDCSDPEFPKLLISEGQISSYAALSYVWGEKQPHCTISDNVHHYVSTGIDIRLQPKTIRDAVVATRTFGLRYLWVDALCILQDSHDDKNREIPQIRKIFEGAYFTIIAGSSGKVSEGFLHDRATPDPPHVRVPFLLPDDGNLGPEKLGTVVLMPRYLNIPDDPINTRAWCLEERLLSARAFLYASDTMRYCCQTHLVNVSKSICGQADHASLPSELRSPGITDETRLPHIIKSWAAIVKDYTCRHVTEERDKLIAIAGIAEKFQAKIGGRYLAGLWERRLLDGLVWKRGTEARGRHSAASSARPARYRAPSWSWASVDGCVQSTHINWNKGSWKEKCEILECNVTLSNPNYLFGGVSGGTLKISGHMNRVTWNHHGHGFHSQDPILWRLPKADDPKIANDEIPERHPVTKSTLVLDTPDERLEPDSKVWALACLQDEYHVAGLLLVADEAEREGVFRRVGYFDFPAEHVTKYGDWTEGGPLQTITII